MRLLGFTPTKKMLIEEARLSLERKALTIEPALAEVDVEPIVETKSDPIVETVVSVKIPTYTKTTKKPLPPLILPTKKKPASELKRKVSLNPLSN